MVTPKNNTSPIAASIIAKCGGIAETARLVRKSESWVHRWTYEKSKGGTGGLVPRSAQDAILAAKVGITPADFFESQVAS